MTLAPDPEVVRQPGAGLDVLVSDAIGSFADTLREAIDRRGLALHRVRDRLAHRGVVISVATLSYWQSGRSVPARRGSLAALPHLEEILGLEPGELGRALDATRPSPDGPPCLTSLWPDHADVLARLDTRWDAELDRLVLHDLLRVGPDRRLASMTTRQVLRATADGPDRRVILHHQRDSSVDLPRIRPVRGCTLGRVVRRRAEGVIAAELLFARPLRRGETVLIEHEVTSVGPGPRDLRHGRRARTSMREYCLEVEFDPTALPASVSAYCGEDAWPVELDPSHTAHLVRSDAPSGSTGLSWTWPDADPS